jgi:ADP-ribose pyrophosphatase
MSDQVYEGKHVVVKSRDGWEYVERKKATEAVAVIAETDDGRVILTEQFRKPVNARVIDWPAGLVGDEGTDDPAATAKKELEEETGFTCERVERLAGGPTSPGITSEMVHLYRATGLRRIDEGGGVAGENITVHQVPRAEVERWLQRKEGEGVLVDLKLWGGLHFLSKSS